MMILSEFELTLISIMACYCVMKIYKKYGIKNAIILILSGIATAFSGFYFNKYIGNKLNENTLPIVIILLIGCIIGLIFWKKKEK